MPPSRARLAPLIALALMWAAPARAQSPAPAVPAAPAAPPSPPASPPAPPSPSAPEALPPAPSAAEADVRQPDSAAPPVPPPADQGPDTLPSLDEDEPPPSPPLAPPPRERPLPSVRAQRRLALLGELGWNGLAGFGAIVAYHVHPHVSFELGAGLAVVGGKLGLRARYNLLEAGVTPFVGVGVMGATGFDAPTRDLGAEDDNTELNIELRPSAFLQTVAGIDWTSRGGFTLVGALGYAHMLTRDNIIIVTGEPTAEERRGLDIAFRSGIVISLALGHSFR